MTKYTLKCVEGLAGSILLETGKTYTTTLCRYSDGYLQYNVNNNWWHWSRFVCVNEEYVD